MGGAPPCCPPRTGSASTTNWRPAGARCWTGSPITPWTGTATWEQPEYREPIEKSLNHWIDFTGNTEVRRTEVGLFATVIALDPAGELRSLTLSVATRPQLHLFAVSLERSKP
ncbi:hypothetical protein [Streptomyces sp. GESEQ-4]|uniref:hypothetical protein n=1 Tax=Streptomyces sp. GESEQ-4 TaxID=2812655 RepID=UPI001B33021A|nr:hypothetical protein [Streptomyces sp. GESEQ-4]